MANKQVADLTDLELGNLIVTVAEEAFSRMGLSDFQREASERVVATLFALKGPHRRG